ncbi:MAG: hypothetical protein ACJ77E_09295 [Gaiellaceae bacterium]
MLALWIPMLAGDSRSAWDGHVLDDPRVTQLWDGDRIAGTWFADRQLGHLGAPGGIVWDAYYAFGPSATWNGTPTQLVAAGSDIIDNVSGLEHAFAPLLRG